MKHIKEYLSFRNSLLEAKGVNESAMSELDLLAKEAKDFKSFTKKYLKNLKIYQKNQIL